MSKESAFFLQYHKKSGANIMSMQEEAQSDYTILVSLLTVTLLRFDIWGVQTEIFFTYSIHTSK